MGTVAIRRAMRVLTSISGGNAMKISKGIWVKAIVAGIASLHLLPGDVLAAPLVYLGAGDTLTANFRMTSASQDTQLLQVALYRDGQFARRDYSASLYDGNALLGVYNSNKNTTSSAVTATWVQTQGLAQSFQAPMVDFGSIHNAKINGRVDINFNGGPGIALNLNTPGPVNGSGFMFALQCLDANGCGGPASQGAVIDSFKINGNSVPSVLSSTMASFKNNLSFASGALNPIGNPYNLSFDGTNFFVDFSIGLNGVDPGAAQIDVWKHGIESAWSDKYFIRDGMFAYGLKFNVDIQYHDVLADAQVTVKNQVGDMNGFRERPSVGTWYTQLGRFQSASSQFAYEYLDYLEGDVAAHEFGHLLSLCDEYPNKNPSCQNSVGLQPEGAMGGWAFGTDAHFHLQPVQERYFQEILSDLTSITGRALRLGEAPTLPSYVDTGIRLYSDDDFVSDAEPNRVPEPSTGKLLFAAVCAAYVVHATARSRRGQFSFAVS